MMGDNPNKDVVIENYVLSTILSWHSQRDKEAIKKAVMDTFHESELQAAMKAFCNDKSVIGAIEPPRQHRTSGPCFEAIYEQIIALDSAGQMPNVVISYKDLFKIPRSFPTGEVTDSNDERITFLERSLTRILSQNELIVNELMELKKAPPPSFRQIVSQQAQMPAAPAMLTQARNHISVPNMPPERNHTNVSHSTHERNHTSVMRNTTNEGAANRVVMSAEPGTAGTNDQWKIQNRRRPRPKPIQGSYKSQAAGHTWSAAPRDIFIYHADIGTTTDDIKELINETSKVNVLEVEQKNHTESYYASFRVSVRRNEYEEATKPEYWPDGWSIREYFRPRAKRNENQGANDINPPTS